MPVIKKKGILRDTNYENKWEADGFEERQALNRLDEEARKYISFQWLRNSGKLLERYYVVSWKEARRAGDKEAMEKYLLKLFFGHFNFVYKVVNIIYKRKRLDDIKTRYDLIVEGLPAFMKALEKYIIYNEKGARFLAYLEKNLQGVIMRAAQHSSVFHTTESELIAIVSRYRKNEDADTYFNESFEPLRLGEEDLTYSEVDDLEKEKREEKFEKRDSSSDSDLNLALQDYVRFIEGKTRYMRWDILRAILVIEKLMPTIVKNLRILKSDET